ncbi:hypothetical protein [Streptomyces sp. CB00455]|uniref:hypothetical protein n=1 Tax=Streptomyces sp. CB00455 TaxID=1703927 RepID=UPI001F5B2DDF|nr:hypothetical protein [Streptomyces sp. CB00455]
MRVLTGAAVRTGSAVGAAALVLAGLSWTAHAAPAGETAPRPVPAYRAAQDAKQIEGTPSTADAPRLEPGGVYADEIAPGERVYRLVLEKDRSNVYVSAVVRPPAGAEVSYTDGIEVEVMTTAGRPCPGGTGRTSLGSDPVPVSAVGVRWGAEDADCAPAGVYYVKVTRIAAKGADQRPWPLELMVQREPGRAAGGPTTAPGSLPSGAPALPGSEAVGRTGGTGFNDARALGAGVWRDELRPGQTLYYRVPLDWGRRLGIGAELAAAKMTRPYGSASDGLSVSLYNPYRGLVADDDAPYDGKQAAVTLKETPPVAYENRFASDRDVRAVGIAGWYYIAVTMGGKAAEFTEDAVPVPLTLRTEIGGAPAKAPAYTEGLAAGGFGVGAQDLAAAEEGLTAPEAAAAIGEHALMRVVAGAGFGTGALLLVVLGGWILLARRGRGATAG